jgi:hypothetical protein
MEKCSDIYGWTGQIPGTFLNDKLTKRKRYGKSLVETLSDELHCDEFFDEKNGVKSIHDNR